MQTMIPVGADQVWAQDSGDPGAGPEPGAGPGDGRAPVIVLLHPGVGDARVWDPMWPGLTARGRVIRYDVRAYGRSPAATQEYTLVGDLRQVLGHFGLDRVHLVGCSMGGGTAVELALAEPGRVASLTLLCPGISGFPIEEDPELEAGDAAARARGEAGLAEFNQQTWAGAGGGPDVIEQLRSAIRAEANEERYQQPGDPAFDRLSELRVPTVLMVGDRDFPPLIASNEEAARRIPGCRLIRVPGADHLLPLREPDLIRRVVLEQAGLAGPAAR